MTHPWVTFALFLYGPVVVVPSQQSCGLSGPNQQSGGLESLSLVPWVGQNKTVLIRISTEPYFFDVAFPSQPILRIPPLSTPDN